jgi:hypothetical protein
MSFAPSIATGMLMLFSLLGIRSNIMSISRLDIMVFG